MRWYSIRTLERQGGVPTLERGNDKNPSCCLSPTANDRAHLTIAGMARSYRTNGLHC